MIPPPRNRSLAQADALYEAEIDAQWRLWHCYLDAHQVLLAAQDVAATPMAFEGADNLAAQVRQAQDDLDHLPTALRGLFDAVVAQYRAQITAQHDAQRRAAGGHGPPVDVDAIDQEVLHILLQGATGASSADGRGLVPMSRTDADEIVWYSVDLALLERIPNHETFTVGRMSARETTTRLGGALILLIGAVLFGIVWFVWIVPGGASAPAAVVLPDPQINDQSVQVWSITALVLTDGRTRPITLPVQARDTLPTHGETAETPMVVWATTDVWPLTLCIAGDESVPDPARLTTVSLLGAGETPDRIYTLHTAPPTAPDLLLTLCADRQWAAPLYGVLQRTDGITALSPGESASLDAATTITLESIQGIGPGEDSSIPDTHQQVVVTVSGALDLDWPHATATLLVADGQRIVSPDIQSADGTTVLRYSVTLMTMPTDVAWQITHPESGRVVRWRTTMTPPPDRATVLAQHLVVEEIAADPVAVGDLLTLHLVLSNRGSQPLMLTPDDIVLLQGDSRLDTPPADALREPILTDGRISVTLLVPVDLTQPLTIVLGAQRYQIIAGGDQA